MMERSAPGRLLAAFLLIYSVIPGFLTTSASAQSADRIAVLTESSGDVLLARAGSGSFTDGVDFGTALFEDDQIKTGAGASASLLYANGDLLTIGPNRSITISETTSDSADDTVVDVDSGASASAVSLALHRSGDGEIAAMSGLRSGGNDTQIELITPANTAVRESNPKFEWSSQMTFSSYRIRIFSSTGVIWEGETVETFLDYPADAPALDPTVEYLWQITGEDMLDEEKSDVAKIRVLSAAAISEIEEAEKNLTSLKNSSSSGNYHFLLGSVYADSGLLHDAVKQFKSLATAYPESQLPFELLATVYTEMGRTDLALNALKKASTNE